MGTVSRVAELGIRRRHRELAWSEVEAHRARALVRNERNALDRRQQPLAVDHHATIVVARDHFHVVREVDVDHAREQRRSPASKKSWLSDTPKRTVPSSPARDARSRPTLYAARGS
jgi:hypothetical protein